LIVINLKMSSA
jgi:hypothetical protein